MFRFLGSLKTRTAVATSLVLAVCLLANALYLIVGKQAEIRTDIERRAELFASLTRQPIAAAYANDYPAGFLRFRQMIREYLALEPSIDRVRVLGMSGQVLFDSTRGDDAPASTNAPAAAQSKELLSAVRGLELARLRVPGPDGRTTLEIMAPYVDEAGRHDIAVAYRITYQQLGPAIARLVATTALLTLLSIVAAALVAMALTRHITQPIEELIRGAQRIAEGHFEQRLSMWSGDELQLLAEAFNHMTARLKENVEQLERSNRRLAEVNEELKELDRLKSDLLANVSHELRTPLTAIKGYTDYMLERKLGPVTEKQEKGLTVVQRNLERLSKSIGALLDFSRMDMGHLSLNIQPFALGPLLDQVLTALRAELERKGLDFTASVEPALPPVIADRERLAQVFENLIINAMKFTPSGGHITISAVRSGRPTRPVAEIRVADTGIGIPTNQLDKIFQRFHQVDGSSTRRFGGVGLGLSIVKTILETHGAPINVESEVGRGTEFRFELPLADKILLRDERLTRESPEPPATGAGEQEHPAHA